jgi:hypothetical protein
MMAPGRIGQTCTDEEVVVPLEGSGKAYSTQVIGPFQNSGPRGRWRSRTGEL